ncbi:MAG: hypothetical protein IJU86_01815 [Firmicutes bacterium]|nr:hypothetical protein [Bacillota bacterium]
MFCLSSGKSHDIPEGSQLIEIIYSQNNNCLFMNRAYEDNKTLTLAKEHGFNAVVPPKKNRKLP